MKPMNKTLTLLKFNFTRIPWVPWEEFQHNIIIFSSMQKRNCPSFDYVLTLNLQVLRRLMLALFFH